MGVGVSDLGDVGGDKGPYLVDNGVVFGISEFFICPGSPGGNIGIDDDLGDIGGDTGFLINFLTFSKAAFNSG